jgi:hydroxyacylglutathione hydrolase
VRANLVPINAYSTLIDDAGASSAYLLRGRERALLIDTLSGTENLADIVRSMTGLPVMVLNTHAHIDHIGGNHFFPGAFLHREDLGVYHDHLRLLAGALRRSGAEVVPDGTECRILPIEPGQVIDLGGLRLEVLHLPGHTRGSIALLDRGARLLYSGDAVNGQMWLQLDHSTPLSEYLATLEGLDALRGAFDGLYGGHVTTAAPAPATHIDAVKRGVREILSGETGADDDWPWLEFTARRHMLGDQSWILYSRVNAR